MTLPLPADRSAVVCSPWATLGDVPESRRALLTEDEWAAVLLMASEILYYLSGRRFTGGGCTETVTLRATGPGRGAWPYHRSWGNCGCWQGGSWTDGWLTPFVGLYEGRHYSVAAVKLPHSPGSVTSVLLNGEVFTAYHLTRSGYLERTDGGSWAMCDDSTEVTYQWGDAPPETGVQAAVTLAVELALAKAGDNACRLPRRVQSITRQGVTMAILDPQDFLDKGRTGLFEVDLFLTAVNPQSRGQRGAVWSPDVPVAT